MVPACAGVILNIPLQVIVKPYGPRVRGGDPWLSASWKITIKYQMVPACAGVILGAILAVLWWTDGPRVRGGDPLIVVLRDDGK
jgi:hypothetical protein